MENFNYTIQIPEPCYENWNAMKSTVDGKFCDSCSKTVIDFSNKTDLEIQAILLAKKDEKVCGHFRKAQINRPLAIKVDLGQLPKNMSATKSFTLALFLVFGSFLFSCKDSNGQTLGEMQITTTPTQTFTKGKIKMPERISREDSIPLKDSTVISPIETEPMISGGIRYIETPLSEDSLVKIDIPPICVEENSNSGFIKGDTIQTFDDRDDNGDSTDRGNSSEADRILRENEDFDGILNEQPYAVFIYPNPLKGECTLRYDLVKKSDVMIEVLDTNGKSIKKPVDINGQHSGRYAIPITLADVSNGIYMVRLTINGKTFTKKLVLEK